MRGDSIQVAINKKPFKNRALEDALTYNYCWYDINDIQPSGSGCAGLKRSEDRNIPLLPNTAQPEPIDRFLFFMTKVHCDAIAGTSTPILI